MLSERMATFGQLAGAVAHEIRSPLSGIKNGAIFILRKQNNGNTPDDHEKINTILDVMDEAINRSNRIITSMIDFARMPANELEETNIRQLVESPISSIDPSTGIQVNLDLKRNMPAVYVDTGMMSKALAAVFDPLFSTRNRGVGLGLPFARQVVRRHGGTLEVFSSPGAGTTIIPSIPISKPAVTLKTFMEHRNSALEFPSQDRSVSPTGSSTGL